MTDKIMNLVVAITIFLIGYQLGAHSVDSSIEIEGHTHPDIKVAKTIATPELADEQNTLPEKVRSTESKAKQTINVLHTRYFNAHEPQFSNTAQEWHHTLLTSQDIHHKISAISALATAEHIEKLAVGLGDSSEQVRRETLLALNSIESDTAIRYISQALYTDPASNNRELAIQLLANRLDLPISVYSLKHTMRYDSDSKIKRLAKQALTY